MSFASLRFGARWNAQEVTSTVWFMNSKVHHISITSFANLIPTTQRQNTHRPAFVLSLLGVFGSILSPTPLKQECEEHGTYFSIPNQENPTIIRPGARTIHDKRRNKVNACFPCPVLCMVDPPRMRREVLLY